jgi:hypothetical protein
MATTNQIQERIEAFARELCEELGEVDASQGVCWLDAIENQCVEIGNAISVALVKQQASAKCAVSDESLCPVCGKEGQYKGKRSRELLTRRGPVTLAEPEYFCPCCRKAFFPSDPSDRR